MDYSKMVLLVPALAFVSAMLLFAFLLQRKRGNELERKNKDLIQTSTHLARRNQALAAYEAIENTEAHIEEILAKARVESGKIIADAEEEARSIRDEAQNAKDRSQSLLDEAGRDADARIETAKRQARSIVEAAEEKAREILGDSYKIKEDIAGYEKTLTAIKNAVQGYGNEYIVPSRSLLDVLADEYGHTAAARDLKLVRERNRKMVKTMESAECDYVETHRRVTAMNFVTDAFNGKVDSVLSRVRSDNYGKLRQEIIDAFALVNSNGAAFRNARVTEEYRDSRLEELRLAVVLQELREREREEQRRIKEEMREEEKARREIERAVKDAAKEEEMLQKAMEKVRSKYESASETQKAMYEEQLGELERKLKEAEERNQRALSMAQQTKRGHVYVISNVGSFGEDVYKIGMTRRLEPLDRVRELGNASVPFPFDVHAMIWSEDAPALETELHKNFALAQVNKTNYRKEFFNVGLRSIREAVEKAGIIAKWTLASEAREYRETLAINKLIAESGEAKEAWLNKQLAVGQLSPVADDEEEDEELSTESAV